MTHILAVCLLFLRHLAKFQPSFSAGVNKPEKSRNVVVNGTDLFPPYLTAHSFVMLFAW